MERDPQQQHPNNITLPLPISEGGTGAKTIAEARQNLGALAATRIGQPLGVVPLNSNAKVPAQYLPPADVNSISISGPLTIVIGDSNNYEITDYDLDTTYTITSETGDIIRDTKVNPNVFIYEPNTITSNNPNTGFTVNGVFYPITVNPEIITKPIINLPVNNSIINTDNITINSSNFTSNNGQSSIHKSIWQISNTMDFTASPEIEKIYPIYTYEISNLTNGLDFYVRVKYLAYSGITSEWSDIVHFKVNKFPSVEVEILHRPDIATFPNSGGVYSSGMALSPDGTILAIADALVNVTPEVLAPLERFGQIYIYKKINNAWIYQAAINNGKSDSTFDLFGNSIVISPSNQLVIVGSLHGRYATYKGDQSGLVQVFKTNTQNDYATLQIAQEIEAAPYDWSGVNLGSTICLSADGNILAIAAAGRSDHPQRVLIYEYDGNSFIERDTITNPNPYASSRFAKDTSSISLSTDGTRLLINDSLTVDGSGCVYVYDYDGNDWNLTDTITLPTGPIPITFGPFLTFSSNKNKFACTGRAQDTNAQAYIYIYELINSVWTNTHLIAHTDWNMNTLGSSEQSINFTSNDNVIIIGSPSQTALASELQQYGPLHADGVIYRVRLSDIDNTWVEEFKYIASDLNVNNPASFGYPVLINSTDSEMITGSMYKHWSTSYTENGAVYIFR